ncbi:MULTISPECIES: hotdog family protein [Glaesserella]|uniref:Dehydratase n=1 Tax=Glaesserella australis TaxID=2094024 RepID=A0A328BYH0_9PAST|nr:MULTISPECIES: hotdog family protein [Glaesserella]AUI66528.1 dehydratase [Glaesserella sp. 15-184]RAL18701.1 dehydratase [Glaesserella australis]
MASLVCPIEQVAPLLPHSGEMVLLDCITDFGDDFLIAEMEVRANNPLIKHGKLATFAGIEIMAQGVAAWSGCLAVLADEPIRLGYLLGTRKLHIHTDEIPVGSRLQIKIKMSIQDSTGFGVFDSQLIDLATGKVILEGALNVFSPKEKQQ